MKKTFLSSAFCLLCLLSNAQINVMYFHGKQRCPTCLSIEKHARELVEEQYSEAAKEGKISFNVTDFSTPEGKKLAEKYKVTFSSLIIETSKGKRDASRLGFQYARTQPDVFKSELKDIIDNALSE